MIKKFKLGEMTKDVWIGDTITECEYLMDLGDGMMLFYDIRHKCFRKVFIKVDENGTCYMNGWNCSEVPSKLLD